MSKLTKCFASIFLAAITGCDNTSPDWKTQLSSETLTAEQFTQIVAEAIREMSPNAEVTVVAPLEIKVASDEGDYSCFLDNAWNESRNDADNRLDVVTRHLESMKSIMTQVGDDTPRNIANVVPVIKDRTWLDQALLQGLKDDPVYREPVAGDIFVVYAEDGDHQLSYISKSEVEGFGLSAKALRTTAIKNLDARLPKIERHGKGPLYMITAGGTFEASLLLISDIWESQAKIVDGRVVVAVPSRDMLMFTGENSNDALNQMKSIIDEIHAGGSYLISKSMLVREDGGWKIFQYPERKK